MSRTPIIILSVFLAASVFPPLARGVQAEQITLQKRELGIEENFAMEFFASTLPIGNESIEDTLRPFKPPYDRLRPCQIQWAKRDLNADGNSELIMQLNHPYTCGSAGCWTFIFHRQRGKWVQIGEFAGYDTIEIDRSAKHPWPRLFSARDCLVWVQGGYQTGSNDPNEMGVDSDCRR